MPTWGSGKVHPVANANAEAQSWRRQTSTSFKGAEKRRERRVAIVKES